MIVTGPCARSPGARNRVGGDSQSLYGCINFIHTCRLFGGGFGGAIILALASADNILVLTPAHGAHVVLCCVSAAQHHHTHLNSLK